ncbi:MAG: rRNA pseudouridine synthase [Planctomycetes bacterium]|nr:rRNA pseudouridine synthase [Planctomycetota bacterium]
MADRLDAFLAHQGLGTRSEVRGLIRSGLVTVGGVVCRNHAEPLRGRPVTARGRPVVAGPEDATLLLHKPLGLSCSHDPAEAPLLESAYPPELAHLPIEPAGRLDRETSGLLVCTTDGQLIHSLTNPKRTIWKRYRIGYAGTLSAHAVERCAKGIALPDDDRPTMPALLELPGPGEATLHLREGRYHQVRRMIAALGGEVVRLHRDRIGALELPGDLPAGACRQLSPAEQAQLFAEPSPAIIVQ